MKSGLALVVHADYIPGPCLLPTSLLSTRRFAPLHNQNVAKSASLPLAGSLTAPPMESKSGVQLKEEHGIRLAIEGCGHGTLHAIYASIEEACKAIGWPGVDLLIIGGDFQAVRNAYDLNCVAMPAKYREMCDFHEYYSGAREAPYLTVFVGGNHEASNYLFELYYGGWVAKNIYYMGAANVLRLGPLRIAGMSGIWKGYNYKKPHHERLPYNESDLKSIYHVREIDARKLLQIRTQVDIGISHDWPRGVEWEGNWKGLFGKKEHLESDARDGQLGSVAAKLVMDRLRPRWWFSAHLHCKYAAIVEHGNTKAAQQRLASNASAPMDRVGDAPNGPTATDGGLAPSYKNTDEVDIDLDDDENGLPSTHDQKTLAANADEIDLELEDDIAGAAPVAPGQGLDNFAVSVAENATQAETPQETVNLDEARAALPPSFQRPAAPLKEAHEASAELATEITNKTTCFLALDKCLPSRDFLQLIPVPSEPSAEIKRPARLEYDKEWLAITRAFAIQEGLVLGDAKFNAPRAKSQTEYASLVDEQRHWIDSHLSEDATVVPNNFTVTAPVFDGGDFLNHKYSQTGGGLREYTNPQTSAFCQMLEIPNPFDIPEEERSERIRIGPRPDPASDRFGSGRGFRGPGRGRGGGHRGGRGRGRGGGRSRG